MYGPDYYAAFNIDPDGYRIEAYYGPGEGEADLILQTCVGAMAGSWWDGLTG